MWRILVPHAVSHLEFDQLGHRALFVEPSGIHCMRHISHPGLREEQTPTVLVRRAREAAGGLVTVTGIAGVGKTTWCLQVVEQLGRARAVVVSADSFEEDLPYSLVDKLLRVADASYRAEVQFADPLDAARLLLRVLSAKMERNRGQSLLMVDNAQWIDGQSRIALRYVLPRLAPDRPLVVLAGLSGRGAEALQELVGENQLAWPLLERVMLEPLDTSQLQRFVGAVHHRELSVTAARRLRDATGGTPLLINAVFASSSAFPDVPPALESISPAEEQSLLAAAQRNPFAQSLKALPDDHRRLVQLIALMRDPMEQEVLAKICAELGWQMELDGALSSGLVIAEANPRALAIRGGSLSFKPSHDLVAAAAVEALGAAERNLYCRAIAGALEDPHRSLWFRLMVETPGDAQLAREIRTGVDDAVQRGSFGQALSYLRGGMRRFVGPEHDDFLIEAAVLTSNALNLEDVLDLLPRIRALPTGRVRDFALLQLDQMTGSTAHLDALSAISAQAVTDHPDSALMAAHTALSLALSAAVGRGQETLPQVVAQGHAQLELVEASPVVHDARLRHLPSPDQVALRLDGLNLTVAAQRAARLGASEAGAAVGKAFHVLTLRIGSSPESPGLMDALVCRAGFLAGTGQIEAAAADLERAVDIALRHRPGWSIGHARLILAYCYYLLGRYEEAWGVIETARLVVFDSADVSARPLTFHIAAGIAATRGETAAYKAALEAAERVRLTHYDTFGYELELLAAAESARASGAALNQLNSVREELFEGRSLASLSILSYRVDALAELGQAEEADRQLQRCVRAQDAGWWPIYGSLDWLRGRVEESYGHYRGAAVHYRAASREERFPLNQGLALLSLGRLLTTQQATGQGAATLRAAARVFRSLGARPYLARTLNLLDEAGQHPHSTSSILESLTGREREIAFFAARGLTNRQIGERLFVSAATVNFHMRNVLAKLGLSSRRDLPRFFGQAE